MITDLPIKRHHSDKHFSEFLPTRWRQKIIDMEQDYVTVTRCIISVPTSNFCLLHSNMHHMLLYTVRSSSTCVKSSYIWKKAVKVNCYKTASPPRTETFNRVRQEALINSAPSIVLFIAATRVCPETASRSVQPLVQPSRSWSIQRERQRHMQRDRQ